MARHSTGYQALEAARSDIANATSLVQLRRAQAVLLPLELGITLAQTAAMIGMTPGWVARSRVRYIQKHSEQVELKPRGGRRNNLLSPKEELAMVNAAVKSRHPAFAPVVLRLKDAIQERIGRQIALSTAYNILNRQWSLRDKNSQAS